MTGLTPSERLVLIALRAAPGRLNERQISEVIYGHDRNGGPLTAHTCARVFIHRLRRKLGVEIKKNAHGWMLSSDDRARIQDRIRESEAAVA